MRATGTEPRLELFDPENRVTQAPKMKRVRLKQIVRVLFDAVQTDRTWLSDFADEDAIAASVERMAADVQAYVPGYRLKQKVQFDRIEADRPIRIPGVGARMHGLKTSIFIEVEGQGI